MSFEIHLQAFEQGVAAQRDGAPVRELLREHALVDETERGFMRVRYRDGEADVYGELGSAEPLTGLLFSHVSGDGPFDLIVMVATTADCVLMPVGCPVCVVSAGQVDQLPGELRAGEVRLVRTGADLLGVITAS